MPIVVCTLPNAGDVINGVAFRPGKDGNVSDEVPDDVAAMFANIPGYKVISSPPEATPRRKDSNASADAK